MRVLVLGSTGRLGRAVVDALAGHQVLGLARHPPAEVVTDRRDVVRLQHALAGIEAVVDLCAFSAPDAEALVQAHALAHAFAGGQEGSKPPVRLVFASSLAAVPRLDADLDEYAQGKRQVAQIYGKSWPGAVCTLLLPQLIARHRHAREGRYLADARELGQAWLPGSGLQKPALAQVEVVARLIAWLLTAPDLPTELAVAHPHPHSVQALVHSLLSGAGLPPSSRPHPDPRWRGPHSGGDEPVDVAPLQALFPQLDWPDLLETYRELGAWLRA